MHNLRCATNGLGLALCLYGAVAPAFDDGLRSVGRNCTSCHDAGLPVPTVTITGPASVTAGAVNRYTVTITGGPGLNAGLDVVAPAGTIAAVEAGTAVNATGSGFAHSPNPRAMVGGTASFTFDWTAPAVAGPVTLSASGLSGNGDGNDGAGDATGLATLAVTVGGGAVTNQPPRALIGGPNTTAAGVTVTFTGTGSTDPDGTIATYDWNFGDGTAGSGPTVTKSFAAGTWAVQLTVTDNLGLTNTAMMPVTVAAAGTNVAPTANAGGPYSGTVGSAIAFNGAGSTDSDGTISAYAWNFGDGSTPGAGVTTSYAYTAAGNYTATLTVTDNAGGTATSQAAVTITAATTGTPPPPPPATTTGQAEYAADCESCHGANGVGGPDGDVVGADVEAIVEAIADVPEMASLSTLPPDHIDAIAAFLTAATDEDDDDDDDDAAAADGDGDDDDAPAPPAAPLAPQGNVSGGSTTDATTSKASARGTGGGAIDAWLVAGLMVWGGRRVLRRADSVRRT